MNEKRDNEDLSKKPNILFFFTDDQRFNTIHALGNDQIYTPTMDKLVKNGVSFKQAHIPSGSSGAVCMPSRAMLMTGRNLFRIKGAGESIAKEHIMLGEYLQRHGYYSFGVGKWHNGTQSFNRNHNDGKDIFFGGMADHWNVPVYDYDPSGKYQGSCPYIKHPLFTNKTHRRKYDHQYQGVHSSEFIANTAIQFLRNYRHEQPFFLYVSFLAPHDPRTMPQKFLNMYKDKPIALPPNFMVQHPFNTGELKHRDERLASRPRKPEEIQRHIKEYFAMISHLDHEIGRVVKILEELNLMENTIIILAGDNGLALGQHGLMGKQNCYEHSNHVPLIFQGPKIPKSQQTKGFVYLFDIFPTICDLVGLPIPKTVDGKSMSVLIGDSTKILRDEIYYAFHKSQRALKTSKYKLIEYVKSGKHIKTQLFDLESDPWETDDLSNNPDHSDLIDALRKRMIKIRNEWEELETYWGMYFWKSFCKSNPEYMDAKVNSISKISLRKHQFKRFKEVIRNFLFQK